MRFSTAAPSDSSAMPHSARWRRLVGVAVEAVPGEAAEHERGRAGELGVRRRRRARRRAPGATPSPSRSARQRVAHAVGERAPWPSSVSTTTKRHGREWCGAGARHAASTSASSASRATGSGRNARIDRRASRNAGTEVAVIGRGPRWAGGRARGTEPSPNHSGSRPRTIATGTPAALPITSSAAAAISSAIATSVTCSSRPERVGRAAQVDDRGDARSRRSRRR